MPDRRYRTFHEPPTTADRVLAHPTSTAQGVASALLGLVLVMDAATHGWASTVSLSRIHPGVLAAMGVALTVGGVAVLVGVVAPHSRRDRVWMVERTGWLLVVPAWAGYAVASVIGAPIYPVAPLVASCFAVGGVLRLVALTLIERAAREKIERLDEPG